MNLTEFPYEILHEIVLFLPYCVDVINLRLSHPHFTVIPQCKGSLQSNQLFQLFWLSNIFDIKDLFTTDKIKPTHPPRNSHIKRESSFIPFEKRYINSVVVHHNQDLLKGVLNRLRNINHMFGLVVNCPQDMKYLFRDRCPSGCLVEKYQVSNYAKRIENASKKIGHRWTLLTSRSFLIVMNPNEINQSCLLPLIMNYRSYFIDVIIYCNISNNVPDWLSYNIDKHIFKHSNDIPDNEIRDCIEQLTGTSSLDSTMQFYHDTKNTNNAIIISNYHTQFISLDTKSVLPLSNHIFWHFFNEN
jgi:hypothetical protein